MTTVETISGVFLVSFLIIVFVSMIYEKKTGVPPAPTLPWVRKKILLSLKQRLNSEKIYHFAELGCGWGGINLVLAKNFKNSKVTGYEISPFPYVFSKIRAIFFSKRIKIVRQSFFEADFSEFDVLICYLSRGHFDKMKPQLSQLKPGSLIISNAFPIPDWEPVEILHTNVGIKIPIFVYQIQH